MDPDNQALIKRSVDERGADGIVLMLGAADAEAVEVAAEGKLLVLEFSKPLNETLSKVYDRYSFNILPLMGRLVANDEDSYRYLAESIRRHPPQDELKGMMEAAGFDRVGYRNLNAGIVAIHTGYRT